MTATAQPDRPAQAPSGEPATLPAALLRHAAERPGDVALRDKDLGRWRETTWDGYAERVAHIAAGLRAAGVEAGDRVAIHAENRIEWPLADLAVQGLGAVVVGVYPTSPAAEVEYLLSHAECTVVFAEDEEQLDKTMAVRDRLPALRKLIVMDPRGVRVLDDEMVTTFEQLEAAGREETDARAGFERSVAALDPAAVAIIVYTSGTTGPPKGAMITHANLMAAAQAFRHIFVPKTGDEILSYLPLSHVAERLSSVVNPVVSGYIVNFGEGGPSFVQDLREVQPTLFIGVPRVYEKLLASVEIKVADASRLKRATYRFWLSQGRRIAPRRMAGTMSPLDRLVAALGWVALYRPVREKLGLVRVREAVSGAAPIAPQVLEWLWALGVPVREGYGMTENTAICTWTPEGDVRLGKVGVALPGVELAIADDGEILTRSAGVFAGYLKNEEATKETVNAEGWLHTGDIGELDEDGFLKITDRKKDIIITAGGKNISPSEIENRLKVSPYVREAMVIGDQRKYLTALIGIELDTVGDWATRRGIAYTTYQDLSNKREVRELVEGWVQEVNREFAQVETIKRFAMMDKELDHEDGELTATQKVKRRALAELFSEKVEGMYS